MTTDELKAAAERLRRWDAGEASDKVYPHAVYSTACANDDAWSLAREFIDRLAADERIAGVVRDNLVPQWQDAPDADGWYWVESLEKDSPPQLIGMANRMRDHEWMTDANGNTFATRSVSPNWQRWTVSGWVPLVGRVCPIGSRPK